MSITRIKTTMTSKADHLETAFNPALDRLIDLVNHQFGCELRYSPLMEISKENLKILRDELRINEPLYVGSGVFFPIHVRGELMGAAQLTDVKDLTQAEVNQLYQVIGLVLESSLLNVLRLDVLQQLEDQLRVIDSSPNVVRIEQAREIETPREIVKYKKAFNVPCLIQGDSAEKIRRAALEIYERTDRHAFIAFHDLLPEVSTSASAIKGLGPITVFVPSIEALSVEQATALKEAMAAFAHPETPQIIVGAEGKSELAGQWVEQQSMAFLKLTEQTDAKVQSQIIDHFMVGVTQGQSNLATPQPQ